VSRRPIRALTILGTIPHRLTPRARLLPSLRARHIRAPIGADDDVRARALENLLLNVAVQASRRSQCARRRGGIQRACAVTARRAAAE